MASQIWTSTFVTLLLGSSAALVGCAFDPDENAPTTNTTPPGNTPATATAADDERRPHGYTSCYEVCGIERESCLRRALRKYPEHEAVRFCERGFDTCFAMCRDARWDEG